MSQDTVTIPEALVIGPEHGAEKECITGTNVCYSIDPDTKLLCITIDLDRAKVLTKQGVSYMIASTKGNHKMTGVNPDLVLSLNLYQPIPERDWDMETRKLKERKRIAMSKARAAVNAEFDRG